jgi:DNA-binding NarL/FixJ family response regulator
VIRVLLVDDHAIVRAGVRGMLAGEADITVVGEAADGAAAITAVASLQPGVVLMDLSMPGGDGTTATAQIRDRFPATSVVVLTTYDDDADLLGALQAGALGYLLKDCTRALLLQAVRAAARGEAVLTPSIAARLVHRARVPTAPREEALSLREVEVLATAARGHSNKEIARLLGIGEATVKTHLLHAFGKLGVQDRTAAVVRALERGLLPHGRAAR